MTLIASRKREQPRWRAGDLLGTKDAAALLGYKSARQFQDSERLGQIVKEFQAVGCSLRTDIWIGGQRRFLRREIEAFLDRIAKV